jgi:hypothetical protein
MTAVSAGTDPAELLVAAGMLLAGLASIRPAVHAYVAWFNRHLTPSAAADVRALRGGRASLPAGLSPEPAGPQTAAASQAPRGRQAVETLTPDSVSTALGARR